MASRVNLPIPGRPKIYSVMREPLSKTPISIPAIAKSGLIEFGIICLSKITLSLTPFAFRLMINAELEIDSKLSLIYLK